MLSMSDLCASSILFHESENRCVRVYVLSAIPFACSCIDSKPELIKQLSHPEFKHSRSDLKRRLSKQSSILSLEGSLKKEKKGGATEMTHLIVTEKVETGNVSSSAGRPTCHYMYMRLCIYLCVFLCIYFWIFFTSVSASSLHLSLNLHVSLHLLMCLYSYKRDCTSVSLVPSSQVKLSVFFDYAKACTYFMTSLVIFFNVITNGLSIGSNFWLAHWSGQESVVNSTPNL